MSVSKKMLQHNVVDIRAECLAVNFSEKGQAVDQIVIAPQGQFKRGYQADILEWKNGSAPDQLPHLRYLLISRNGLYDILPEGIFHRYRSETTDGDHKAVLRHIQENREEEQAARTFFLAIEREFYRQRILLEKEERRFLQLFHEEYPRELFLDFWELQESCSERNWQILYLLPLCSQLVGKPEWVLAAFKMLLKVDAVFEEKGTLSRKIPEELMPVLGNTILGNTLTPGKVFQDGMAVLQLTLGPLLESDVEAFLPGGPKKRLLKKLCELLFPADITVEVRLRMDAESIHFMLNERSAAARLGYSTIL